MNLSPNFTLEELQYSSTAIRHGIDNTAPMAAVVNLTKLCTDILEPVRELLVVPLHIDSGYRSPLLNALVGSTSEHSAHLDGNAADFIPTGWVLRAAFDSIRSSHIPYDQLIIECGAWIHISRCATGLAPRRESLVASGSPGNWTYERVV